MRTDLTLHSKVLLRTWHASGAVNTLKYHVNHQSCKNYYLPALCHYS